MNMFTKKYILAATAGAAATFAAPAFIALAQTDLWVGGNTDCTSTGYQNAAGNQQLGRNSIAIPYSTCDGSFAPYMGSTRADVAIDQGVAATRQAWDANCGNGVEECTLHGFSLGAPIVTIVGNDVGADKPGSNTHVVTEGNAWGQPGVFGGKPGIIGVGINIAAPFIPLPQQIPQVAGSENRFNVNDGFADDATQPPWAEITDLSCLNGCGDLPPQHWIQTGQPTAVFHTNDGVTQKVYGAPLPGVIAPQNNPAVNPELSPVRLDTPEFFGELPCSDGKFTPGEAPC